MTLSRGGSSNCWSASCPESGSWQHPYPESVSGGPDCVREVGWRLASDILRALKIWVSSSIIANGYYLWCEWVISARGN